LFTWKGRFTIKGFPPQTKKGVVLVLWGGAALLVWWLWFTGPNRPITYASAPYIDSLSVNPKLIDAIDKGNVVLVKEMLDHGASANSCDKSKDEDGMTALSSAAFSGRIDIVKLLLDRGAIVNVTEDWGANATFSAAVATHPQVLQLLIDRGGDVNADEDGATALDLLDGRILERKTGEEASRFNKTLDELKAAGARHSWIGGWAIFFLQTTGIGLIVIVVSTAILWRKREFKGGQIKNRKSKIKN
jgi:hypothetical protein